MLNYSELKPGKYIVLDGQPYVVMEASFLRMQQRKPVMQTKLKNLINDKTVEKTFQHNDKIEEAEIEIREVKYLYSHRGEFWFCEKDDASKRFMIEEELVAVYADLMKPNMLVGVVVFNDKIIGVKLPIKIELKVIEAPPAIKGNTAQGGTKQVKLETGVIVNTPLFVENGDIILLNTETREYVERVKKGS